MHFLIKVSWSNLKLYNLKKVSICLEMTNFLKKISILAEILMKLSRKGNKRGLHMIDFCGLKLQQVVVSKWACNTWSTECFGLK